MHCNIVILPLYGEPEKSFSGDLQISDKFIEI